MNASLFNKQTTPSRKISDPGILPTAIREKEFGLFDSVFHEVSNAIAIISREPGSHSPVIRDVNHHFELVTEYHLDEIIGQSLYDFIPSIRSGSNFPVIEEALESRQAAVLFCSWVHKNGKILDMDMTIRPFSSEGGDSRFICILRENNGENNIRDKAAREIKQNLLAAMHHNFKTPLNGILGYSEVIMSEMLGPIGQESYKDCAQDIHGAGRDLLHLIDNLLDLKELETAEFTLQEEKFPLTEMVAECIGKLSLDAEKASIDLFCKVDPNCKNIFGDKSRLQQTIHSLLTNALKFTPHGGEIIISARRDNDGGCLISCIDNGAGMGSQQLAKIFCHDTHLSNIYSTPTVGIGFGLIYVKQLIERHDGSVSIISAKGKGTTVTLYLPPNRLC